MVQVREMPFSNSLHFPVAQGGHGLFCHLHSEEVGNSAKIRAFSYFFQTASQIRFHSKVICFCLGLKRYVELSFICIGSDGKKYWQSLPLLLIFSNLNKCKVPSGALKELVRGEVCRWETTWVSFSNCSSLHVSHWVPDSYVLHAIPGRLAIALRQFCMIPKKIMNVKSIIFGLARQDCSSIPLCMF